MRLDGFRPAARKALTVWSPHSAAKPLSECGRGVRPWADEATAFDGGSVGPATPVVDAPVFYPQKVESGSSAAALPKRRRGRDEHGVTPDSTGLLESAACQGVTDEQRQ